MAVNAMQWTAEQAVRPRTMVEDLGKLARIVEPVRRYRRMSRQSLIRETGLASNTLDRYLSDAISEKLVRRIHVRGETWIEAL